MNDTRRYSKLTPDDKRNVVVQVLKFFKDDTETGVLRPLSELSIEGISDGDVKKITLSLYWALLLDMGGFSNRAGYCTSELGLAMLEELQQV